LSGFCVNGRREIGELLKEFIRITLTGDILDLASCNA
jgi:hypothetical protein